MEDIFSFEGRSTRTSWWIIAIISYILCLIVSMAWGLSTYHSGINLEQYTGDEYSLLWIGFKNASLKMQVFIFFGMLFTLWIWSASNVKRYHDLGKSGVWMLVFFIPLIGPLWNVIECGFISGTCGENQYDHSNNDNSSSYDEDEYGEEMAESEKSSLGKHNFIDELNKPKPMFGA